MPNYTVKSNSYVVDLGEITISSGSRVVAKINSTRKSNSRVFANKKLIRPSLSRVVGKEKFTIVSLCRITGKNKLTLASNSVVYDSKKILLLSRSRIDRSLGEDLIEGTFGVKQLGFLFIGNRDLGRRSEIKRIQSQSRVMGHLKATIGGNSKVAIGFLIVSNSRIIGNKNLIVGGHYLTTDRYYSTIKSRSYIYDKIPEFEFGLPFEVIVDGWTDS